MARSSMSPTCAAHPGQPPVADAEGVLQVTADGQRRAHRHRAARRAAGHSRGSGGPEADHGRRSAAPSRRTGPGSRRSWLSQASARSASRSRASLIVGDDGFAGQVAAGHHQRRRAGRVPGQPEEQVVDRGVGQHHPEVGGVRGDVGGHAQRRSRRGRQQDHGSARVGEQSLLGLGDDHQLTRRRPGRRP